MIALVETKQLKMETKLDIGRIGEKAAELELLKLGYDVINLNDFRNNYENADLICMNPKTGKSVMIQVKTGTTKNIMTGLTSELDGTIPNLEQKIIGPWVFIKMDKRTFAMEFYVLTREETIELISSSNDWYVNGWNRQLKSKPMVGIEVSWLQGKTTEAKTGQCKKQYREYKNILSNNSQNSWHKIMNLLD
jgi:Holliday junction resolvase-like predicted endonuclease